MLLLPLRLLPLRLYVRVINSPTYHLSFKAYVTVYISCEFKVREKLWYMFIRTTDTQIRTYTPNGKKLSRFKIKKKYNFSQFKLILSVCLFSFHSPLPFSLPAKWFNFRDRQQALNGYLLQPVVMISLLDITSTFPTQTNYLLLALPLVP